MPNAPSEGNSVLRVLIKYSILVIRARGLGGSAGCVGGRVVRAGRIIRARGCYRGCMERCLARVRWSRDADSWSRRSSVVSTFGSASPVPLLNAGLSRAYRSRMLVMLFTLILIFHVAGLVLALLLLAMGCTEGQSFTMTFVLSVGQFVSLGEEGLPRSSDEAGCVYTTMLSSIFATLLQAFTFALFVSRVLNPPFQLLLPRRLICLQRDGEFFLSLRLMHPQGHTVSQVVLSMAWVEPRISKEGERMALQRSLAFVVEPTAIDLPFTLLIPLKGSPLEPYAGDLNMLPNFLMFTYSCFDEVLRTSTFERLIYHPKDFEYGTWRSVLKFAHHGKEGVDVTNHDVRADQVDLAEFHTIDRDPTMMQRCRERFGSPPSQPLPEAKRNTELRPLSEPEPELELNSVLVSMEAAQSALQQDQKHSSRQTNGKI